MKRLKELLGADVPLGLLLLGILREEHYKDTGEYFEFKTDKMFCKYKKEKDEIKASQIVRQRVIAQALNLLIVFSLVSKTAIMTALGKFLGIALLIVMIVYWGLVCVGVLYDYVEDKYKERDPSDIDKQ